MVVTGGGERHRPGDGPALPRRRGAGRRGGRSGRRTAPQAVAAELEAARPGSALGVAADVSRRAPTSPLIVGHRGGLRPDRPVLRQRRRRRRHRPRVGRRRLADLDGRQLLRPPLRGAGAGARLARAGRGLLPRHRLGRRAAHPDRLGAPTRSPSTPPSPSPSGCRSPTATAACGSAACARWASTRRCSTRPGPGRHRPTSASNVVKAAGDVLEPEQVADIVAAGHRRRALPDPPPPRGAHVPPAQGQRLRPVAGRHATPAGPRHRRVKRLRGCRRACSSLLTVGGRSGHGARPPAAAKSFAITSVATSARLQPDAIHGRGRGGHLRLRGRPVHRRDPLASRPGRSPRSPTSPSPTRAGNALGHDAAGRSRSAAQWEWAFAPTSDASADVHRHLPGGGRRRGRARRRRAATGSSSAPTTRASGT